MVSAARRMATKATSRPIQPLPDQGASISPSTPLVRIRPTDWPVAMLALATSDASAARMPIPTATIVNIANRRIKRIQSAFSAE
jgi:hypothetical protein